MSKTDNTRPLLLQWDDHTESARIKHGCSQMRFVTMNRDCDYHPRNNLFEFRTGEMRRCWRETYAFGGKRSFGGRGKIERKQRRRKIRRREREALHRVWVSGGEDDFDLLPIREDCNTLDWDLS